jgi:hypothetical protein
MNKEYLGDGVYVSFDGYQLWLHVTNDQYGGQSSIALEPIVFAALVDYEKRLRDWCTGKRVVTEDHNTQ